MNAPIVRLFVLFVVLFAVLVAFTSRWTVFEAASLRDNPDNRRQLIEEARVKRGRVTSRDGTLLARSVPAGAGTYTRRYPERQLFSQTLGYAFTNLGRAGTEQEYNPFLTGEKQGEVDSVLEQLQGKSSEGDDLRLNLDPQAQRVAVAQLGGRRGAIVAMEPRSGKVRVIASVPQYDPNDVDSRFRRLNREPGSPLLNRVTQAGYKPGSTMKVVTASAAIDTGRYEPGSTLDGRSPQTFGGVPLNNFGNQSFGTIDLTQALTQSVNTVWARVGTDLGIGTMARYMQRFGFYDEPPMDYPRSQMRPSGEFNRRGRLLDPRSRRIDVARMSIGDESQLAVTPLQMATVAATIGNGGVRMEPRLGDRVTDRDGREVEDVEPVEAERVVSRRTAQQVTEMMANVVREGSGTAAALEGVEVAGKTGTAEKDPARRLNQVWFIGFAPRKNPKMAVAVTIETVVGGTGGEVAAPIAKRVLESLL